MLRSDLVFNAWRTERGNRKFKGTLLGIAVSFFIIFFLAYLLNLADKKDISKPSAAGRNQENGEMISHEESAIGWNWREFFSIKIAQAATVYARSDYKAQVFIQSASNLELEPGAEAAYRIGFKNIGRAPWFSGGVNFVSIYTFSPKYRNSDFRAGNWYGSIQPAKLKDAAVNPGQIGYVEFKFKAPQTAGNYTETFKLAAENKAWIEGGEFSVPITVKNKQAPASGAKPAAAGSNFQAALLLKSADKISAKAGEVVDVRFGFKNTGTASWDIQGLIVPPEDLEGGGNSIFYHSTWLSGHQPMAAGHQIISGQIGFLDLKLKAPETAGTYNAKFKLVVNYDKEVAGGEAEIPIYVADESEGTDQSGRAANILNMAEPQVEVGLNYFDAAAPEAVELTADRAYQITDKNGAVLGNFSAYESVRATFDFSNKIFTARNARVNFSAAGELHFKGLSGGAVFTILSMNRPYSGGWNDNKYRDEIILRQADTTGRLWTINRLSLEKYLWGIAETSNISPIEYIKSIITAARTYALYHYLNPYKYNGYFTVRATTADQLYRGYNSESRSPRVVEAVNATRGMAVTYGNDVVATPYFGHSDGTTRSWSAVFGGADKPWLKPVAAPYDAGLELWGHGVGMSANDAYGHAQALGWNYAKILKYYYNGIEVMKIY